MVYRGWLDECPREARAWEEEVRLCAVPCCALQSTPPRPDFAHCFLRSQLVRTICEQVSFVFMPLKGAQPNQENLTLAPPLTPDRPHFLGL